MNGKATGQLIVFLLEFVIPAVALLGYPYTLAAVSGWLLDVCGEGEKSYSYFKRRLRVSYFVVSLVYSSPFVLALAWVCSASSQDGTSDFARLLVLVVQSVTGVYCLVFLLYQIPVWIAFTLIFRSIFLGGKLAQKLPWRKKKTEQATTSLPETHLLVVRDSTYVKTSDSEVSQIHSQKENT